MQIQRTRPMAIGPMGSGATSAGSSGFSVAPGQQTGIADYLSNNLGTVAGALVAGPVRSRGTVDPTKAVDAKRMMNQDDGYENAFHRFRNIAEVARQGNFEPEDLGKMVADVVMESTTRYQMSPQDVGRIALSVADSSGLGEAARMALGVMVNGPVGVDQSYSLPGQDAVAARNQKNTREQKQMDIDAENARGVSVGAGDTRFFPENSPFTDERAIQGRTTNAVAQGEAVEDLRGRLANGESISETAMRLAGATNPPSANTTPMNTSTRKDLWGAIGMLLRAKGVEVDDKGAPVDLDPSVMDSVMRRAEQLYSSNNGFLQAAAAQAVDELVEQIPDANREKSWFGFGDPTGPAVKLRSGSGGDADPLGIL
jgi:hypothetical protein